MLALVCHYAGRPEYWVSFHDAMSRLPPGVAPEARLLADTFADPLTAPARALAELDDEIRQAARHRRRRCHHAVRDRRVLHRPLDGLP